MLTFALPRVTSFKNLTGLVSHWDSLPTGRLMTRTKEIKVLPKMSQKGEDLASAFRVRKVRE